MGWGMSQRGTQQVRTTCLKILTKWWSFIGNQRIFMEFRSPTLRDTYIFHKNKLRWKNSDFPPNELLPHSSDPKFQMVWHGFMRHHWPYSILLGKASPSLRPQFEVIDFTVTLKGLEQQLLGKLIGMVPCLRAIESTQFFFWGGSKSVMNSNPPSA